MRLGRRGYKHLALCNPYVDPAIAEATADTERTGSLAEIAAGKEWQARRSPNSHREKWMGHARLNSPLALFVSSLRLPPRVGCVPLCPQRCTFWDVTPPEG